MVTARKKTTAVKVKSVMLGTNAEPKFFDVDEDYLKENLKVIIIQTLNWYSYNSTKEKNELWMLKSYPKLKGVYSPNLGFLCRMVEQGFPKELLEPSIKKLVSQAEIQVSKRKTELKEKSEEKQKLVHPKNKDLFGKTIDLAVNCECEMVDHIIDALISKNKPDVYSQPKNLNNIQLNKVKGYIDRQIEEFTGCASTEGYKNITKRKENEILKKLREIRATIDSAVVIQNKIKAKTTSTRKKKPVDNNKIVKDFLVVDLKDHPSVNPVKMLNATTAFVYDGESRRLSMFNALKGGTIRIKGKTVIDFDETNSFSKILRKPEDQIKALMELTTKARMIQYFNEKIKTVGTAPRVRNTKQTTILKTYTG